MPRGKRRNTNQNISEDERPSTKRPRNTYAQTQNVTTRVNKNKLKPILVDASVFTIMLRRFQNTMHNVSNFVMDTFRYLRAIKKCRRQLRNDDIFSQRRCLAWFREYTNLEEPNTLGPDGMERFCEDIGVEPENVVMLVLAYKMGASQMGYFSQCEWVKGLTELECDTAAKMQSKLDYLKSILNDPNAFKSIYRYSFDFAKDSDQRSMDIDTAKAMLNLLLGKQWVLYAQFAQFLEQSKYKVINKDQWCNILEFSRTINNNLTNYDFDGAWPVMLDEFVEWLRQQRGISDMPNRS